MEKQYTYAVARIRANELSLLTGAFMEQLLSAKTMRECLSILSERGWKADGESNEAIEAMLSFEQKKTWDLIRELTGGDMSAFDVFLYANDYHNLKAAIKEACTSQEVPGIYMKEGTTIPYEQIRKAIAEQDFGALPERMQEGAREAMDLLLHTRDGQLCDVTVDRAALEDIGRAGKACENRILKEYGELTVATTDIKIAVRCAKAKKDAEFAARALAPCDTLDVSRLAAAAGSGEDEIMKYLESTVYSDALSELKRSPSAFEKWCDDRMMDSIRQELYHPFTIGPLAAYILARESEIRSVRIILTGKLNDLAEEQIRERVRKTYV